MGSQRVRHDLATKQQILEYHLESHSICDMTFNHHVTPSNPKSFPNLIFYDLIVLKIAGQVIFIMSLNWYQGRGLGRNTTKIMCHFPDISRVHMINPYHWWQPGSCGCRRNYQVRLLNTPCQNTAPLPIPYLLEGNDYTQPIYLRNEELCSTSMRAEYLHKLFVILRHGKFFYSLLFLD